MIIQGTNIPLVITFDEDVSSCEALVITLWRRDRVKLKQWNMSDVTIEADVVTLPISQEESAAWPEGYNMLEAKGLDENGYTIFWEEAPVMIEGRRDKDIRIPEE